jgi:hypothetical protein
MIVEAFEWPFSDPEDLNAAQAHQDGQNRQLHLNNQAKTLYRIGPKTACRAKRLAQGLLMR